MNERSIALIERLASAFGKNADVVIDAYSAWSRVNAAGWFSFGVLLLLLSVKLPFKFTEGDDDLQINKFIQWITFISGILIMICNFPHLVSPEGVAINRLLRDIAAITN